MGTKKYRLGIEARFWPKVDKTTTCWNWTGGRDGPTRYGKIWENGLNKLVHRVSWELAHGAIPSGMVVCHRCDNPICVNPAHLFIGSQADNIADKCKKGRVAFGQRHGMALLCEDDVREIRRLYANGKSQRDVAEKMNISQPSVWQIINRKTWKHVA